MKRLFITAMPLFLAAVMGCGAGPKSGKGFTLPDGDAKRGQEVFVGMQCHACHSVKGLELPVLEEDPEPDIDVRLGGLVPRIQTYGELVTSVINPSHRLAKGYSPAPTPAAESGEEEGVTESKGGNVSADDQEKPSSPMTNYNDAMTVTQLIDLVAFLQSRYELIEYEATDYSDFY